MKDEEKFEEVVSDALRKTTEFELPRGFADRVVSIIQHKAVQKEARRDRWWLVLGLTGMIGALVFAFTKVKFIASVGVFTFVQSYWGLVIFGVVFIIALQVIDRKIVSHRSRR